MAGETVVKVPWGPRPESHQEPAGRRPDLLGRLTELSAGALADWRWDGHGTAPCPLLGPVEGTPTEGTDRTPRRRRSALVLALGLRLLRLLGR